MKRKFEWGALVFLVCFVFIIRFGFLEGPAAYLNAVSPLSNVSGHSRYDEHGSYRPPFLDPRVADQSVRQSAGKSVASPSEQSASVAARTSLGAWGGLKRILNRSDLSVEVEESFREGILAWKSLLPLVNEAPSQGSTNDDKLCPESVGSSNDSDHVVALPCGLILDSSITVVATPIRGSVDFRIDLIGSTVPGDPGRPPIVLHYNVRIHGDLLTDHPVIIQNTWSSGGDWEEEERCPSPVELKPSQVDGLDRCVEQVGASVSWKPPTNTDAVTSNWVARPNKGKPWFPFVEGMPFAATIWVGWEAFHVTVNGKHISSFQYRQGHEPSLVGTVEVQGGLRLSSIFATGLPVSENMTGAEYLKAPPLPPKSKRLPLFIGVFSSSSNFDRRMAQRKSWMQYDAVRSGEVVVRFFVGLHTQEQVNKQLWDEAKMFGDVQLLPFVDYYHLITLKTAAICIYVTEHIEADYVMKTDDDTFVRVDVILSLIQERERGEIFLLGEVETDSAPSRDRTSKWFVTMEEWPHVRFPPWAHGPGYIFSSDIAKFASRVSASPQLKLFKLEDVAMGIWIDEFQQTQNRTVEYVHNAKFISGGCEEDYVTAHYQTPRQMLCLWNQLQRAQKAACCN